MSENRVMMKKIYSQYREVMTCNVEDLLDQLFAQDSNARIICFNNRQNDIQTVQKAHNWISGKRYTPDLKSAQNVYYLNQNDFTIQFALVDLADHCLKDHPDYLLGLCGEMTFHFGNQRNPVFEYLNKNHWPDEVYVDTISQDIVRSLTNKVRIELALLPTGMTYEKLYEYFKGEEFNRHLSGYLYEVLNVCCGLTLVSVKVTDIAPVTENIDNHVR